MADVYTLDGLPSDIFTSEKEYKRRVKVTNERVGKQRRLFAATGNVTPLVGEIIMISKISFELPTPVNISINGLNILEIPNDTTARLYATYSDGDFITIDLTQIGTYIRLTDADTISGATYLGYYELTQEDTFSDYRDVNDLDIITSDSLDFQVLSDNPYKDN